MKKKYFIQAIGLALMMSMAACGDDDNNGDNGGNGGNGGNGEEPTPPDTEINAQVSSWADRYSTTTYQYNDQGALTSGSTQYAGYNKEFTIQGNPLSIQINETEEYGEGNKSTTKTSCTNIRTNDQGFMTAADVRAEFTDVYEGNTESGSISGKIACTYDSDGQITEYKLTVGTFYTDSYIFSWQDGRLMKVTNNYEDEESSLTESYTFDYGTGAVENSGIYLGCLQRDEMPDCLFYGGYLGKTTRLVPTACTYNYAEIYEGEEYTDSYSEQLTVQTDSNGRITLISSDYDYSDNACAFAYDGQTAQWPGTKAATGFGAAKKKASLLKRLAAQHRD